MANNFDVEIFAEKIFVFKNIFDDPQEVISMMNNMDDMLTDSDVFDKSIPWKASSPDPFGNEQIYGKKRMSHMGKLHTSSEEIKEFYNKLHNAFYIAGRHYFDTLGMEYKEHYFKDIAIFQYDTGQEMGPHVDYDGEPDLAPIATGTLYLNSNKEGGDLYFKEQDVLVKTEAGTLVIFPCTKPFYHQSTLLTSGLKYHVANGWKGTPEDFKNN